MPHPEPVEGCVCGDSPPVKARGKNAAFEVFASLFDASFDRLRMRSGWKGEGAKLAPPVPKEDAKTTHVRFVQYAAAACVSALPSSYR